MSNRINVLKHILENGPSTREGVIDILKEATGVETNPLRQTFYQLVKAGQLEQHGDTSDASTTYSLTDSGKEYYERNKDKPARKPYGGNGKALQEVQPAPVIPNLSAEAERAADSVSAVLAQNSEYRNALLEIRSTVNRLLGEDTDVITFGGDLDGKREHSHSD